MVAIIVVGVYAYYLNELSLNVPFLDEYDRVLQTLIDYKNNSFSIFQLFSNSNEHINVFVKTLVIVIYEIFNEINFVWLTWIAFVGLILLFINIISIDQIYRKPILVLIITLLFFQFRILGPNLWSLVGLQHFYSVLFSLLAIKYALKKSNKGLIYSGVFTTLGVFTFGNGIVIPIVVFMILIFEERRIEIYLWFLYTMILYGIFFYNYSNPHHLDKMMTINQYIHYFLMLIGAFFKNVFETERYIKIAGLMMLLLSLYILFTNFRRYKAIHYFLIFVLLVQVLITINRTYIWMPLDNRYQLYSILSLVLLMIDVFLNYKKSTFLLVIVSSCLYYSTISNFNELYSFKNLKQKVLCTHLKNEKNIMKKLYRYKYNCDRFLVILDKSIKENIYNFDDCK